MGTITVKSSSIRRTAEYENQTKGVTIDLDYTLEDGTMGLMSINGHVYMIGDRAYVGRFNGSLKDGEMIYSTDSVKGSMRTIINECIDDIETILTPSSEEE